MKIVMAHHTDREDAKRKLVTLFERLAAEHQGTITDLAHEWEEDVLRFGFRARGVKAEGIVEVTDREVILDGRLPLLAKPFESRIKSTIEKEGRKLFQTA